MSTNTKKSKSSEETLEKLRAFINEEREKKYGNIS